MAKTLPLRIGRRDLELLSVLDLLPLTVTQFLRLSRTFPEPFPDEHTLRRRLRKLINAGFLSAWPFMTASPGRSPQYFRLTRDGYRLLHGEHAPLPHRRFFEPLSPGHHAHTQALSEFVVHLLIMSHRHHITLQQFARENSLCLEAGEDTVYPDCAFQLRCPDGRVFHFVVELDNGSERVRSTRDVESIERKLRTYDRHQSQYDARDPQRYFVLFVVTGSPARMRHILSLASAVMENPQRTVFLAAQLTALRDSDPFCEAVFEDHRGLRRTLLPWKESSDRAEAVFGTNLLTAGADS